MVQPYWTPPFHREAARGAIIGLTMAHSRAHIYRAILEGFAYEIRAGYEVMAAKTGVTIREIRVSGGGSKSDAILSIVADVLGGAGAQDGGPGVFGAGGGDLRGGRLGDLYDRRRGGNADGPYQTAL